MNSVNLTLSLLKYHVFFYSTDFDFHFLLVKKGKITIFQPEIVDCLKRVSPPPPPAKKGLSELLKDDPK